MSEKTTDPDIDLWLKDLFEEWNERDRIIDIHNRFSYTVGIAMDLEKGTYDRKEFAAEVARAITAKEIPTDPLLECFVKVYAPDSQLAQELA